VSARRVAFVGADGALGTALAGALGARLVSLRCPDMTEAAPIADLAEADVVINAAGPRHHPGLRWSDYLREHVGTAARVARSLRPGAYLVQVGSAAVFGARRRAAGETTPEDPASFPTEAYAWAKLASEHAARAICRERGVALTVLRPTVVYGPGAGGVLSTLRAMASRGVRAVLSPAAVRQHFVHVDLLGRVLEALVRGGARGDLPMLVVADPFVLTAADVNEALRR
jgi:nucleoside-diphosphate-sugar epimerase